MSKAMLVMDMPDSCDSCPLFKSHYSDMCCGGNDRTINYPYPRDFRQDWCPLREVPQEADIKKAKTMTTLTWLEGWNACIDEILKGSGENG